jgi:probable HAF family extracellular repeat protein
VGFYSDSSGHDHGFLLSSGGYATIDDPSGTNTIATGINDAGQIVGQYLDSNNVSHGFLYSGGSFTTIDDPLGGAGTRVFGINNAGQISGTYIDSSRVAHGFLATPDTDTMAEPPTLMAPSSLTVPAGGFNANGDHSVAGRFRR